MSILEKARIGLKYREKSFIHTIFFVAWEWCKKMNLNPSLIRKGYFMVAKRDFNRKWLKKDSIGGFYYDFKCAKLPYDPDFTANEIFQDIFFIPVLCGDNYDAKFVRSVDEYLNEGVYGFTGEGIDVTIKPSDVVLDAGAWIGDFSAYAANKKAVVYAFEPTTKTYDMLCRTVEMNPEGEIIAIKQGLGERQQQIEIFEGEFAYSGNSLLPGKGKYIETVTITTIDQFVKEQGLDRIDFIKADIEGFERNMLLGARETLQKFAPKLAICTYHLPDDPEVLEKIIKEANPAYCVVHTRKKLFAQVLPLGWDM